LLITSGWVPGAAPGEMATLHVYSADPSGIGSTLLSESTSARNAVQLAPTHPGGWKANWVDCLLMSGLTVQSGRPLPVAATGVLSGSKAMSACTPATCAPAVVRKTVNVSSSPGAPAFDPTLTIGSAIPAQDLRTRRRTLAPVGRGCDELVDGDAAIPEGVKQSRRHSGAFCQRRRGMRDEHCGSQ
jgi:hypothetical protein